MCLLLESSREFQELITIASSIISNAVIIEIVRVTTYTRVVTSFAVNYGFPTVDKIIASIPGVNLIVAS